MDTAVLLIVFNRPDYTAQVFEAIRKAAPKKLYISADAPRDGNEKDEKECKKTREIVKKVDWECDVHYRFLEKNHGCGFGVSSAITWAFEKEDSLIILEDDCVPSLPFFYFCKYCLEKYADYSNIWIVNGRSHHQAHSVFKNSDYIYSRYPHCWGWATWKRAWMNFDITMALWPKFKDAGGFSNCLFSAAEYHYFDALYKKLFLDSNLKTHSWAYPFMFNFISNGALAITPGKNLIQNIGIYGVHSSGIQKKCHTLIAENNYIFTNEPEFVISNRAYDYYHFKNHINKKVSLVSRVIMKIRRLLSN